jgi:CubicO group peptidase (beta-lactamase class C family)
MQDGHRQLMFGQLPITFAPSRIFDVRSYASGGGGMAGTASDFMKLLEALRTRDERLLQPATYARMSENQIGDLQAVELQPGWRFGYGASLLIDPAEAKTPLGRGTLSWGGVYGHSWYVDRAAEISIVLLTNTAFEGMNGRLPTEVVNAVYGR